jgi:uncharacterized protein (TIGR02246 family)
MKNIPQYSIVFLALIAVALNSGCSIFPIVNAKVEEQTIRGLDEQFGAFVAKKDAEGAVALYAPDATMLSPDAPAAKGIDAIRAVWVGFVKTPGAAINIVPEKIDIAAAGDIATDVGRAILEMDSPQGHLKVPLEYVVVWRKINGQWKIMYDVSNSETPAAK